MSGWQRAERDYVVALRAAGRREGTIRLHRHYLRHARRFVRSPWCATTDQLRRALADPSWSPETRKSARSVFVTFWRWGHGVGLIEHDPAVALAPVRVPAGKPRPTPEPVYRAALDAADQRTRLMLKLGRLAGMRCGEIAHVRGVDLDDRNLLRVTGKGGAVRPVPVVDLELLGALRAAGDGYLFPNGRGGHLTAGRVSEILADALPGPWTGHTLRHALATAALAGTRDLLAVSELLGHSRPETTKRYALLPPDALLDAVRAAAV